MDGNAAEWLRTRSLLTGVRCRTTDFDVADFRFLQHGQGVENRLLIYLRDGLML